MPLDSKTIEDAVRRYRREFDCYEKMCKYVAAKCEAEIVRANTMRAAVTARAKTPDKFRGKLAKKYALEVDISTVDDAIRRVSDLAGVRISTYLEKDREKVVAEIQKLFEGPNGEPVDVDQKDDGGNFYRAHHCQVVLKQEDLDEPYDNLIGVPCEIQVCSMLAHVWNELEHDLGYKPTTGKLSQHEEDSLSTLGHLTVLGDVVITQLFEANAARLKEARDDTASFQDIYDFVAQMRDSFPESRDFGDNAGQLFEDLQAMGYDTPKKVKGEFLTDDYAKRSQKLLEDFERYLNQSSDGIMEAARSSSDALLVLVLDKKCDEVVKLHKTGRGLGRPPRISSFASRFQRMKSAECDS